MKKFLSILFLLAILATNASAQNYIRLGGSKYGKILYNWDGKILFNRDGDRIISGDSKYGNVIWTISGSIPTPLLIFLLY